MRDFLIGTGACFWSVALLVLLAWCLAALAKMVIREPEDSPWDSSP